MLARILCILALFVLFPACADLLEEEEENDRGNSPVDDDDDTSANDDDDTGGPAITGTQTEGVTGLSESVTAIVRHPDGGYIAAGWATGDHPDIGGRVWGLDGDLTVLWTLEYPNLWVFDMALAPNGDVIVGGESGGVPTSARIARIDAGGTELWRRDLDLGTTSAKINSLDVMPDGNLVFGGWRTSPDTDFYSMAFVRTTGPDGLPCDTCWRMDFDSAYYASDWDHVYALTAMSDGGIVAGGASAESFTSEIGWVMGLDANGAQQWFRDFPNPNGGAHLNRLVETGDGGIFGVGLRALDTSSNTLSGAAWLLNIDADGFVIQDEEYSMAQDSIDTADDATPSGNGFVVVGSRMAELPMGWIARYIPGGAGYRQDWERFVGPSDYVMGLHAIAPAHGSGYVIGGFIGEAPMDPLSGDALFMLVDASGNCPGCF